MCKIKVSAEFRREIPPRNSRFRGEISRRNTALKGIPVITHKNQLTGVSRCFAAKKTTVAIFFFLLFKYNFKLDVFFFYFISSCINILFTSQSCIIIVLVSTVTTVLLFKFHYNLYASITVNPEIFART